jgi:hypothetical protein
MVHRPTTQTNVHSSLQVELNATALGMDFGYSELSVTLATQQPWGPGSYSGVIAITLANTGNITGVFGAAPTACCLGDTICPPGSSVNSSGVTITGGMTTSLGGGASCTFLFTVGGLSRMCVPRGTNSAVLGQIHACQLPRLYFHAPVYVAG